MTLVDFIELSDDEIFKDDKTYIRDHAVHQGIGIYYLSSDDEAAVEEDHTACAQGHALQSRAPLSDGQAVSVAAGEDRQQASESGDAAEAIASSLVMGNGNLSADTSQTFPPSSTTVPFPSQESRGTAQIAKSCPASSYNKDQTSEAPGAPWMSPRLDKKHNGIHKPIVVGLAAEVKSSRMPTKAQAPDKPWKSPRLDEKHKGAHKSVVRMALDLKRSRMCLKTTSKRKRKRKNTPVRFQPQANLPSSATVQTSASVYGCENFVNNASFFVTDAVTAQTEEVGRLVLQDPCSRHTDSIIFGDSAGP